MIKINLDGNINFNKPKKNPLFNLKKKVKEEKSTTPFKKYKIDNSVPQFNNGVNDNESQTMNSLLSDTNVPLTIKRKHWWVFSRDTSLTFLDEKRKKDKLLNFDIIKIDTLNALPYYDYTFEIEKEINILRNAFEIKLDRALGTTKANQLNERIAQKSQFNEMRQINKDESSNANAGFISKLLNRR